MDPVTAKPVRWDRSPITNPGLYDKVPIDHYHGRGLCDAPSVSSSGLRKIFKKSPAHFYCSWPENPDRDDTEDESADLLLGRAAHHLLLGEDAFSTQFVGRPDFFKDFKTNAAREWKADMEAQGRSVLVPAQIETIRGMARSLSRHPLVRAGILNGMIEQTMIWRDGKTGLWKKARPDAVPNDSGDFSDLKTTRSVTDDDLRKTIAEYGYHAQGAMICEGWKALTGSDVSSFTLVFVEKSPPYCCRVITLTPEDLLRGARQNRVAMDIYARCLKADYWPGPGENDAEYLSLPKWEQDRIDYQLDRLEALNNAG